MKSQPINPGDRVHIRYIMSKSPPYWAAFHHFNRGGMLVVDQPGEKGLHTVAWRDVLEVKAPEEDAPIRVFLVQTSYHKQKWSGRAPWPVLRILAPDKTAALSGLRHAPRCGFRVDHVTDVTGIPHAVPFRTAF